MRANCWEKVKFGDKNESTWLLSSHSRAISNQNLFHCGNYCKVIQQILRHTSERQARIEKLSIVCMFWKYIDHIEKRDTWVEVESDT